jgi:hypothetical protein
VLSVLKYGFATVKFTVREIFLLTQACQQHLQHHNRQVDATTDHAEADVTKEEITEVAAIAEAVAAAVAEDVAEMTEVAAATLQESALSNFSRKDS